MNAEKPELSGRSWIGRLSPGFIILLVLAAVIIPWGLVRAAQRTGDAPCSGRYLLCEDFASRSINLSRWRKADQTIGDEGIVRPDNLVVTTVKDNDGGDISVLEVKMFGDRHASAPRQGGVLVSRQRFGSGRYEVRMRNLPGPHGCSCFWTYHAGQKRKDGSPRYTEIDIEMPAHITPQPPAWTTWRRIVGLNTWSRSDADQDATYLNNRTRLDPFDGRFHVYGFDWSTVGNEGAITWYMDGQEIGRTREHVSDMAAEIWLGAWPAPWPGMTYDFDTERMYVDWIKVSVSP